MSEVYFTITTTREVADNIERVLTSQIHAKRSIQIGGIMHEDTYSVVQIKAREKDKKIEPEDIFWVGYFTQLQNSYSL